MTLISDPDEYFEPEVKSHIRLRRPCDDCELLFTPKGKSARLCPRCFKIRADKARLNRRTGSGTILSKMLEELEEMENDSSRRKSE